MYLDLEFNGHNAKTVRFETDYKTVSDEWGMNSHTVSYLKGAVAELETE